VRLLRFRVGAKEHYGDLQHAQIVSLSTLSHSMQCAVPNRLEELVARGPEALDTVEDCLKNVDENLKKAATHSIEDVQILTPITNPPKLICLGLNFHDHAAEAHADIPDEPIIFMKPRTAIIGPNEPIVKPDFVTKLDYEVELAIVIGKRAKSIPVDAAKQHIFGYTILNDVSARDIQFKDRQWTRGKSFDTFAPIGPCIATTNQIPDPRNLKMRTWINGEIRQDSSTRNMVFDVYKVVHHLSRAMTLEPGDIIATGTPSGVGFFVKPEPKFLKPGDRITMEIEKIGRLENFVAKTPRHEIVATG